MHVGVLGGGFLGCCTALALAERGVRVVLFDRNETLLSRTAVANEGKVHLGYMYAGDPTLRTARAMIEGALSFAPFLQRFVPSSSEALRTSVAAAYVLHRETQHSAAEVTAYLTHVHRLVQEAAHGRREAYFGLDLSPAPRRWGAEQRGAMFNPEMVLDVFDTPEVAINPESVAPGLTACIADHPGIEVRLGSYVSRAEREGDAIRVTSTGADRRSTEAFDHVVNALWDGRLALDETIGLKPDRPWLHRLKYGMSFTLPPGMTSFPSMTVISGPFGEVVSYPDRLTYLTWYPECLHGISAEVAPPEEWATYPPEPLRSRILEGTIRAISGIMPRLAELKGAPLPKAVVRGGVIVAWGGTDIYDPQSELHRRYEIGINSSGRYHSVDPGKLTMAPYFAEKCAQRITGAA